MRNSTVGRPSQALDQPSEPGSRSTMRVTRTTLALDQRRSGAVKAPLGLKQLAVKRARQGLVWLICGIALYCGASIASVYVRYQRLLNEMEVHAEIASNYNDQAIRSRLAYKADALGLPDAAGRYQIKRTRNPSEITISSRYQETVDLPFYRLTLTFRPQARARLARISSTAE